MNNSVYAKRNSAKAEMRQRKLDAGFVKDRFPEVEGIVVSMAYQQRGMQKSLNRVVNFFPDSSALFVVDCLNKDCVNGGFDLTRVITAMIRHRKEKAKGDLSCEGEGPSANHSTIAYEVAIKYI